MSVMNQSGDEQAECPLCLEPLEVDDLHFYPCTCGYQICRFCWNRIREGESGLCPACRKAYPENPADFTPLSQEQVAALKTEKRAREQQRRNKTQESRRQLSSVRVVQKNLVFVVGLPVRLADPEILKRPEYFGKYGKIHKVVINHSTAYAGSQGPSASAYVTYVSSADALRAIQNVNNVSIDGRVLKGSLGTTKYCANFMRNQPCPKPDCMYLHELGDPKASFTKEEMHQGLHQMYEKKLHNQLLAATASANGVNVGNSFIPTTVVTSSSINIANPKSKNSNSNSNGGVMLSSSSSSTSSSSSSNGSTGGKEAWPSLGASPPPSDPQDSTPSPQPPSNHNNRTEQSSSSTKSSKQNKNNKENKDNNNESNNSTRSKESKSKKGSKNKSDKQQNTNNQSNHTTTNNKSPLKKQVENSSNGTTNNKSATSTSSESLEKKKSEDREKLEDLNEKAFSKMNPSQNHSEPLDLDADDRHSLLDSHDLLLDNSDHSLLEDNDNHDLLADAPLEHSMLFNRHMGNIANQHNILTHNLQMKNSLVTDFGTLENREQQMPFMNEHQINHNLLDTEELMMLKMRQQQKEFLLRHNEMLTTQNHSLLMEPTKQYLGNLDTKHILAATAAGFRQNPNVLPPFGMRMDGTIPQQSQQQFGMGSQLQQNNQRSSSVVMNGTMSQSEANHHLLTNGFDSHTNSLGGSVGNMGNSEGRYVGENSMDRFFLDFHRNQQLKGNRNGPLLPPEAPSLAYIESQQVLQRKYGLMQNGIQDNMGVQQQQQYQLGGLLGGQRGGSGPGSSGDEAQGPKAQRDDDLDFEWLMERQKLFAELIENDMQVQKSHHMHSGESGECVGRRSRHPPPGFTHMNAFGIGVPRPQPNAAGIAGNGGLVSDWTQLDPAIVSGMCSNAPSAQAQHSLLARFRALSVQQQQQQQQDTRHHNGMALPPQHMMSTQQQQFQQQQRKLMAAQQQASQGQQPGSFWMMPSENINHINFQNRNGFYTNASQIQGNVKMGQNNKYASIPLPPGFSANVTGNAPVSTECIESK